MSKEKMPIEKKKCTTPEFRVSFPHVFKKHQFENNEPKYMITMLFPKSTDLKELKRAVHNAATEKWGLDKTKWPKKLKMPFRDGEEKEELMGYAGNIFVAASSKQKPGVIGNKKVDGAFPQLTEEDGTFYAGCYARATLIAFAYDTMGNRGVAFALQNLQKLRDGEQFSGRKKAEDEFDEIEDGSDNEENYESSDESSDEYTF